MIPAVLRTANLGIWGHMDRSMGLGNSRAPDIEQVTG